MKSVFSVGFFFLGKLGNIFLTNDGCTCNLLQLEKLRLTYLKKSKFVYDKYPIIKGAIVIVIVW